MKDPIATEKRTPTVPKHFRASEAVAREQQFEGQLPVSLLPRLSEALSAPAEALTVRLQFSAHPKITGRVRGRIEGRLPLTCQRSLAVFSWPLAIDFDWLLVRDEAEEGRVLHEADPVMLEEDGELQLRDAIEDEVLLALPLMPIAPGATLPGGSLGAADTPPGGKTKASKISHNVELDDSRPNPFAALKGQFKPN